MNETYAIFFVFNEYWILGTDIEPLKTGSICNIGRTYLFESKKILFPYWSDGLAFHGKMIGSSTLDTLLKSLEYSTPTSSAFSYLNHISIYHQGLTSELKETTFDSTSYLLFKLHTPLLKDDTGFSVLKGDEHLTRCLRDSLLREYPVSISQDTIPYTWRFS